MFSIVPRKEMSLFSDFGKFEDYNRNTWNFHLKENLKMCDLLDIVVGSEKNPSDSCNIEAKEWAYREKIARVVIKNSLGTIDYRHIRSARTATEVWEVLNSLYQPTGAQGIVD